MSAKERDRLSLLSRVRDGQLTLAAAAGLMEVCYRQARRLLQRFKASGAAGLVHRLRGRPGNRGRASPADRERALSLCRERYADFGPTLAAEYLAKEHELMVDHETLRRWLIGAKRWKPRRDAKRQHRRWRERRKHAGQMVQMDGSHHAWFEERGPRCVLMVMVDDATGWTWARFHESESTEAAMGTLWSYIDQRGLPRSLYVDKHSIHRINRATTAHENLTGKRPLTQFGRAMADLGVELICAHSPQAKGRVERKNGTLQDRLVKALRLAPGGAVNDIEAGNAFLEKTFLAEHNERFAVKPAEAADLHHAAPPETTLRAALSIVEERTVGNDYCVQWRGCWLQLTGTDANLGLRGQKVTVRQTLCGELEVLARGRVLEHQPLPQRPAARKEEPAMTLAQRVAGHRGVKKPGPDHQWNRSPAVGPSSAPVRSGSLRSPPLPCATPGPTAGSRGHYH